MNDNYTWAYLKLTAVFVAILEPNNIENMENKPQIILNHTKELLLEELFIYTLNSPCLRNSGHDSCMDLLIKDSAELYKSYGIKTIVGYSKWYDWTVDNFYRSIYQLNQTL